MLKPKKTNPVRGASWGRIAAVLAGVLASGALAAPALASTGFKSGDHCTKLWVQDYTLRGGDWPAAPGHARGYWVRTGFDWGFPYRGCPF